MPRGGKKVLLIKLKKMDVKGGHGETWMSVSAYPYLNKWYSRIELRAYFP
jgi:hypothetical protein